jgi:hypothetical protein
MVLMNTQTIMSNWSYNLESFYFIYITAIVETQSTIIRHQSLFCGIHIIEYAFFYMNQHTRCSVSQSHKLNTINHLNSHTIYHI